MQEKNNTQKFPRFGFRRNTHNKDGTFNRENANVWQAHVWNRTVAKDIGSLIPSREAIAFDKLVEKIKSNADKEKKPDFDLDEEEVAFLVIKLIECGMVVIEPIDPYETDIYDDGVKFWKK